MIWRNYVTVTLCIGTVLFFCVSRPYLWHRCIIYGLDSCSYVDAMHVRSLWPWLGMDHFGSYNVSHTPTTVNWTLTRPSWSGLTLSSSSPSSMSQTSNFVSQWVWFHESSYLDIKFDKQLSVALQVTVFRSPVQLPVTKDTLRQLLQALICLVVHCQLNYCLYFEWKSSWCLSVTAAVNMSSVRDQTSWQVLYAASLAASSTAAVLVWCVELHLHTLSIPAESFRSGPRL